MSARAQGPGPGVRPRARLQASRAGSAGQVGDPKSVLLGMGFEGAAMGAALLSAGGDPQLAIAMLVSCHHPQQSVARELERTAPSMGQWASASGSGASSSSSSSVPLKLEVLEQSCASSSQSSKVEAARGLEASHDEGWQCPPARRLRPTQAALKLRGGVPEMSEDKSQPVLFTRRVRVDCSFPKQALQTCMEPRQEKVVGKRGKTEVY